MKRNAIRIAAVSALAAMTVFAQVSETNVVYRMWIKPLYTGKKAASFRTVYIAGPATNELTTVGSLTNFVSSLPKGSTIFWDTGCFAFRHVPVGTNRLDKQEFTTFCQKHQVTFLHQFGF